ncbi:MAG: DNA-3-methyladenine glycosylase I [Calditrichaeota bacterium]|nr:MAG: DNA-3-methyladenine glycosylase I [Calditrichota bacterium]
MNRCGWVINDQIEIDYHDKEWGVPLHDDRTHFEFLVLDGAQAGLSWITILRKRENYRKAFDNFEPEKISLYDDNKIASLLQDSGIIRNKLKINSAIKNAKAFLKVQKEFESFDKYIWQFVNFQTIQNDWKSRQEVPATSKESDSMSKDLKKRGFSFVGSTICYAYMQSAGMVNDHTTDCFRYKELKF